VKPKESVRNPISLERPSRALCLGGGNICSAMMDRLLEEGCRMLVLDNDLHCKVADRCRTVLSMDRIWEEEVPVLLMGDAISSAVEILELYDVDLLVPGIPGHAAGKLAMAWSKGRLSPRGSMVVMEELEKVLSDEGMVSMDPENGTIICTLNIGTERCPLNCSQEGPCPITGRSRQLYMDMVLEEVLDRLSIKGLVIRPIRVGDHGVISSEQIRDLRKLLGRLDEGDAVAIATSCSCHAIMNVFKVC